MNVIEQIEAGGARVLFSSPQGRSDWARFRRHLHNPGQKIVCFKDADFSDLDLAKTNFDGCDFEHVRFAGADLASTSFKQCRLRDVVFDKAELNLAKFEDSRLEECSFRASRMRAVYFHQSTIEGSFFDEGKGSPRFKETTLLKTDFKSCQFETSLFEHSSISAVFLDANLAHSRFKDTELAGSSFSGANLSGASFERSDLSNSDFRNAVANTATAFERIESTEGMKIDKFTLNCLEANAGGLSTGQLSNAEISDDFASLRAQFSGVWSLGHWTAIFLFLFPYVALILGKWIRVQIAGQTGNTTTLLMVVVGRLLHGHDRWETLSPPDLLATGSSVLFLGYNAVRLALLWKTKKLQTDEEVYGIPVRFHFGDHPWWHCWYRLTRFMFWIGVLSAAVSTGYFLSMQVPK